MEVTCFSPTEKPDKVFVKNYTENKSIDKVYLSDGIKIQLPNLSKYNYGILSPEIRENSISLLRVDKNKQRNRKYNYCLLKIEKSPQFRILDSTCIIGSKSNFNFIDAISLSNDESKLAILYKKGGFLPNEKSRLEILNLKTNQIVFKSVFNDDYKMSFKSWSPDDQNIILSTINNKILILGINSNQNKIISNMGYNAIWLDLLNKISFLKNDRELVVLDLNTMNTVNYKIDNSFLYKFKISKYYWFSENRRFLIKGRLENKISEKVFPWISKSIFLNYECND